MSEREHDVEPPGPFDRGADEAVRPGSSNSTSAIDRRELNLLNRKISGSRRSSSAAQMRRRPPPRRDNEQHRCRPEMSEREHDVEPPGPFDRGADEAVRPGSSNSTSAIDRRAC